MESVCKRSEWSFAARVGFARDGDDVKKPRWGKPGFRKRTIGSGETRYTVLIRKRHGIGAVPVQHLAVLP
jgi:hypothetical protein